MQPNLTARPPLSRVVVYLFLSFPLGALYFPLVVAGLAVSTATLIAWIGFPLLLTVLLSIHGLAQFERHQIAQLSGLSGAPAPMVAASQQSLWQRLGSLLRTPRTWSAALFLVLKMPLGIVSFLAILLLPLISLVLTLFPLAYWINTIIDRHRLASPPLVILNFITINGRFDQAMFVRTFFLIPVGVLCGIATYFLLQGMVALWRELARSLLGLDVSAPSTPSASIAPGAPLR